MDPHTRSGIRWAAWAASRGTTRRFLEERILPPLDDAAQLQAGVAAAESAVKEAFGLDIADFTLGVESVSGSVDAAGGFHVTQPDPTIPQDPGAAAFFDVDNTLIQGSSLVMLGLGLTRHKYVTVSQLITMAWKQLKFRVSGSENPEDVAKGREMALDIVRGRSESELISLCEEIFEKKVPHKLWPGTRELAEAHLAAGQQVWLVSATPVQVAQVLARHFGFTGALGTVPEVKDDIFTGRMVGDILHGPGKKAAVAALASIEGLDLERCTAYSDSINDVPMLSMVGNPVAINPDRKLRKEAQKRGWRSEDFRNLRLIFRDYGPVAGAVASIFGWRWIHKRR